MVGLTRRALLARGAVGGAGLIVAACGGSGAGAEVGRTPAQADVRLLSDAIGDEVRCARRLRELASELGGEHGRLLERLAAGDERHAEALRTAIRRLGGPEPEAGGAARRGLPQGAGLEGGLGLAEAAARAYLELLPRLLAPEARTLVAFVLAEEAAHAGALRSALGRAPVPGAFL